MKQHRTSGTYVGKDKKVTFNLPVLSYEEDGLQVIYAPALDLFGYGKSEGDAKESFKLALEEFLKQLGWEIKPKKNLFKAPSLGYMLEENEQFNSIFNKKNFVKYNEQFRMRLSA